ncbi:MAG TPA: succinyldiaminopimelate transaminase [Steroidobacteraceae bacterium]|nr:succinyldiaminopimelate transaminase [Steroidobacteraceae bacterium]
MNSHLERLQTYPFEKLALLTAGLEPPRHLAPIKLSIGEPQHAPPDLILEALRQGVTQLGRYPATIGTLELRAAAARWLERRFGLPAAAVDPRGMVLPVNGTREALFGFVQAAVEPRSDALVLMPNPFYQIYEGAALLAGAAPYFLDTTAATGYLPDLASVPPAVWRRCQVLMLCSPGNPTGAVWPLAHLRQALALAAEHDFVIAADECYAEIYLDERSPPASLLEAALASGHARFERCIVFHSLSKRSSVPGLRSGFVAGDPQLLARFLLYRTYQGGAMSPLVQAASIAAWSDDAHAAANRRLYREKFQRVVPILQSVLRVEPPAGAFYLWADVGGDDEQFVRELYAAQNVTLLPGRYLARAGSAGNPGAGRVRISLTASLDECLEAAERIRDFTSHRSV